MTSSQEHLQLSQKICVHFPGAAYAPYVHNNLKLQSQGILWTLVASTGAGTQWCTVIDASTIPTHVKCKGIFFQLSKSLVPVLCLEWR